MKTMDNIMLEVGVKLKCVSFFYTNNVNFLQLNYNAAKCGW